MRRAPETLRLLLALLAFQISLNTCLAQFRTRTPVDLRDSVYLNVDTVVKSHLLRAEAYLDDGQWAEAINILQQILENSGEKLIELAPNRYTDVRTYCQHLLAGLPAEALAEYRARVDAQAEAWYQEGRAQGDSEPLRRVVEHMLPSSWGDDALDLLAELSLERGEYARARTSWQRILPPAGEPQDDEGLRALAYPDTNLSLADIRAKMVLVDVLAGNRTRARSSLQRFSELHPDAEGMLAGRRGLYRERLAELLAESTEWSLHEADSSWTTFAGSPTRTKRLPRAVDVGAVQWKKPLKLQHGVSRATVRFRAAGRGKPSLSYHPLLVDDLVFVNDEATISAYRAKSGEPAWPGAGDANDAVIFSITSNPPPQRSARMRSGRTQAVGTPHYTMTVADNRLYARMGYPLVSSPNYRRGFNTSIQKGSLICLDLSAQGKLLWEAEEEDGWAFEGSPVADRENAYIAIRRNSGFMPEARVVCYDARSNQKKWDRLICQGTSPAGGQTGELSHNLLTLADGVLYYCTNLGAIAALDARDGRIRWIVTYPRSGAGGRAKHFRRNLNPCVVSSGTVLVAPSDSPLVMALDAETGRLKWQTELLKDVVHLLGVGQGNLIATGDRVWAVNLETGKVAWHWPDTSRASSEHGRGVLVSGEVYWPVQGEIYVLRQSDGSLVRRIPLMDQHGETGGNLLVAGGYLLVAQVDELVAFSQYSRLFERYKDEIAKRPDDASAHFNFARAAEATERWDLAAEGFRQAKDLATSDQHVEGAPLRELAVDRLFHLLVKRAERSSAQQQWQEAVGYYREAARDAPGPSGQLSALLRTAETWIQAGKPAAAVATYQSVLQEDRLRSLTVAVSDKLRLRCDLEVAGRIEQLIAQHGRAVYATIDEQAAQQFALLVEQGSIPQIEQVVERYPNAEAVSGALMHLARLYQEGGRPERAASVYTRLLRNQALAPNRAELLFGLVRCYEQQGLWQQARQTWEQLRDDSPDADLSSFDLSVLAGRFVEQTLSQPPYASLLASEAGLSVELPLTRRWHKHLSATTVLIPEGERPDLAPSYVFVGGEGLECLAAEDGSVLWTLATAGTPVWLGYAGEHLLVATGRTVTAVYASNGEVAWHWSADHQDAPSDKSATPSEEAQVQETQAIGALADFVVAGSRLVCREGRSRLWALDCQTGGLAWSFKPSEGTLGPRFQCDRQKVSLQTVSPSRLVVLDTLDGRVRFELESGDALWSRTPLHLDATRLCLVSDRVHVQMHDAERGGLLWEISGPSSPANGPPDVLGDREHLLVVINGYLLERVDLETGKVLWQKRLGTEPLAQPRKRIALDATALYCVSRGELKAFRLSDGELLWKQRVGTQEAWQVKRLSDYVACYPVSKIGKTVAGEVALSASVLFFRPENGMLVEQLNFPGNAGEIKVHFTPEATLVVRGEDYWSLGALQTEP